MDVHSRLDDQTNAPERVDRETRLDGLDRRGIHKPRFRIVSGLVIHEQLVGHGCRLGDHHVPENTDTPGVLR